MIFVAFLVACLSASNANAHLLKPPSIINATGYVGEDPPYLKCVHLDDYWYKKEAAQTSSCLKAIFKLPRTATPGEFHRTGAADDYRLPVVEVHERCKITIDLESNGKPAFDTSSWPSLAFYSKLVANACEHKGRTAGRALVGDNKGIEIRLSKIPRSSLDYSSLLNVD